MNKTQLKGLLLFSFSAALPIWAVAPGRLDRNRRPLFRGVNFAHRGLHSRDRTVPENSLSAFRAAAQAGYGIELDVQLSRDGKVVVFHDSTLDRVCGIHAAVSDLTYRELQSFRLCGTQECIPLFSDVLDAIDGCEALIVELKNGKRNRELCQKTKELLDQYRGNVCIESFNPLMVAWFRFHAPGLVRGQLASTMQDYNADGVEGIVAFLLHNTLLNFLSRPHFIAYRLGKQPLSVRLCNRLGALNFGWTSRSAVNEQGRDAVIFEYYRPRQRFL